MAAKKKAAKAGAGAYAAGKAVRSNEYVQRLVEDQELRELKDAAASLKEAADSLRGQKKRKRRKGRLLFVGLVGAGLALALSEGLRKKVLDALFGAEEEFEYTASTTPQSNSTSTTSESEPVGAS
jgi:hypothetical protein